MGLIGKFGNMLKQTEEEENMDYEDFYENDEEPQETAPENNDQNNGGNAEPADNTDASSVTVQGDDNKVHFVLFKPETFDKDVTTMADRFIQKDTLILNMEQTNKDVAKRIIDFLGGVAYAHQGKISRVAEDTYIVMPSHVDITGDDLMDEVESDNVYF